jgi:hypothetical protein
MFAYIATIRISNLIKDQDLWICHVEKQVTWKCRLRLRTHNDGVTLHGQMLKRTMDVNNKLKPNLLLLHFDSLPSFAMFSNCIIDKS